MKTREQVETFLKELSELTKKHGIYVTGEYEGDLWLVESDGALETLAKDIACKKNNTYTVRILV